MPTDKGVQVTASETPPPVLSYHSPARAGFLWRMGYRVARAMRHFPRPSRWTVVLAVLAGLAIYWLWTDHGVWGRLATFTKAGGPGGRLSPDGERLVVGFEGPFTIVEARSGRTLLTFGEAGEKIAYVKFSPDGSRLVMNGGPHPYVLDYPRGSGASGDPGRTLGSRPDAFVRLWDPTSGKRLGNYTQDDPESNGPYPSFSPDGRRLVLTEASRALLHDAATGELVSVLARRDGADAVGSALVSPDSKIVALFIGREGRVQFHSADDGKLISTYDIAPPVAASLFHAAFSPDSKTLALEIDQRLLLLDPATGLPRMPPISLSLLCRRSEELIFTPDGARLIVLGDIVPQQVLIPIDVASGQVGTIVRLQGFGFRDPPIWSPDGRWLLLNSYDAQFIFDATTLTPHPSQPPPRKQFTFSPDFTRAAVIAGPGRVEIVETKGWKTLSTIDVPLPPSGRPRQVVAAAFAGDGEHLLTSTNGDVSLWRRRRPEAEWGIIALPQCWAVIVFGAAMFLSAARDLLRFVSPAPEPAKSPAAA